MMPPQSEDNDRDVGVVEEICGYLTSTPRKSFFLFAGAGSGKTRTLVEVLRRLTGVEKHDAGLRFANQLRGRGQSIRVITYTRNAVSVISGRLGANQLTTVSTIHAFCWDLIAGFDDDIREALIALTNEKLDEARQTAQARKRGPTAKDQTTIEELEAKIAALRTITRFIYNPDRNTHGEGALQHAQVLSATAWLLGARPTLRTILTDRHPVILIDESQDTMRGMLDALMRMVDEAPSKFTLGLLGDHRQRIYTDGHQDLPSLIPRDWALPQLVMNHRSQQRIVELINRIWEAELDGRTQPANGVRQHARSEKCGGFVRIFVGDTKLASEEKIRREARCAEEMAAVSDQKAWRDQGGGYQVLALEHKLAARRGGFFDLFEAMLLIDPDAAKPQGNGDNAGPTETQVLLREAQALAACVDARGDIDEFAVVEVLNLCDRLCSLPVDLVARQARLAEFHEAVKEFAAACSTPESNVRDILAPVIRHGLFEVDEFLVRAFHDQSPAPVAPARISDEPIEDRKYRGVYQLLNSLWVEVGRYSTYMAGGARQATHQVVKGSEFEHVMVVMDDDEAGGNFFSYDKIFGAVKPSQKDLENVAANKETSIDRTLRLLYVTCSRARESLALVLWSSNPEEALWSIKAGGWFSESEITRVPEW